MTAERSRAGEGAPFCPHCGYDLRADEPITIGDAHFDPRRGFFWRDQFVHLPESGRIIIGTIMKADGRWVSQAVLAERIGYEGDNVSNLVGAQICKTRARLREAGVPEVFDSKPGPGSLGYRWIAPAVAQLARAA